MTTRFAGTLAGLAAAAGIASAFAAEPPPAFAPANVTQKGVRALAANCAACHGTNGRPAAGSVVPGLAGRPASEIATAMEQFRAGSRPATVMQQIAKGYSEREVAAIARYFSEQY